MSDNKHPISEFIIKFLLNCLIALILCFFLFMFLFGASIGVNYFKDSNIFLKIIIFLICGFINVIIIAWYFLWKCKFKGEPLAPMDTAFPF
mgnify:CR=1 FL=1